MTFGLRCFQPACRPHPASLPVRVPTVESLLRASFGFTSRLRLAFRYGYRHRSRLAPFIQLDSAHAGHTGADLLVRAGSPDPALRVHAAAGRGRPARTGRSAPLSEWTRGRLSRVFPSRRSAQTIEMKTKDLSKDVSCVFGGAAFNFFEISPAAGRPKRYFGRIAILNWGETRGPRPTVNCSWGP
jgi:hypothetical protein